MSWNVPSLNCFSKWFYLLLGFLLLLFLQRWKTLTLAELSLVFCRENRWVTKPKSGQLLSPKSCWLFLLMCTYFFFCFAVVVVVVFLKLCGGEWSAQEWTFCTDQCRSACVRSRSRLFTRDDDWATPSIKATSWNPLVAAVCCVDQTSSCYYQEELRCCYRGSHPEPVAWLLFTANSSLPLIATIKCGIHHLKENLIICASRTGKDAVIYLVRTTFFHGFA